MVRHPGGLVCVTTAARILGVSTKRINTLIDQGRLPVIRLPDGTRSDVYVPFDSLLAVPARLNQGKKRKLRRGKDLAEPENPYVEYSREPYKEDFSRFSENHPKYMERKDLE